MSGLQDDAGGEAAGQGLLDGLRRGTWLRRGRVAAYCRIFLVLQLLAMIGLVVTAQGAADLWGRPLGTDFISFYAAGRLAAEGRPADAYRPERHEEAERDVTAFAPDLYYAFYYPPPVLLVCRLLASFPYLAALALWVLAGLAAYAVAVRRIDSAAMLPALAFPACFICVGHGQTGFAVAALFGAGTLLIDRRPALAGLCLGLLALKPHLVLLVPVALVAGRHWRAAAAAAAVVLALAVAATAADGWGIWQAYAAIVPEAQANFAAGRVDFAKMASVFGAARRIGAGPVAAAGVQAVVSLAAAATVAAVWAGRVPPALRNAVLIADSLLAAPLLFDYDLVAAAVAAAWLHADSRRHGFVAWERSLLAILFIFPLISRPIGMVAPIPLAPLVPVALVSLLAASLLWPRNRMR